MRSRLDWGNPCLPKGAKARKLASIIAVAVATSVRCQSDEHPTDGKRLIAVSDTIEMTEFADRGYFLGGDPDFPVAIFSPDRKQFLVRLKKGNLKQNLNEYSLLLFRSEDAVRSSQPKTILRMSSSSNREAIQQVRWLGNTAISFLGERPGRLPQVYRLDLGTGHVRQLTHHPTPVVSYDLGRKGSEIVYEAAPAPIRFVDSEEVRRNGLVISTQDLEDLLPPQEDERDEPRTDRQLFIQSEGARAHRIPSPDYLTEYLPLSLSPNGRYAVLAVYLGDVPKSWAAYQEPVLRRYIVDQRKAGTLSNIQQYMLLDVRAGKLTPLVDAPKAWLDEGVRWSADSRSVVVSGVYLPPTGEIYGFPSAPKGQERLQHPFVVEVNLADRAIHVVAGANWRVYRWDTTRNRITLLPGYRAPQSRTTLFKKRGADWVPTAPAESEADVESSISVTLEEDMNTPPRLFVTDRNRGEKSLLLDLNPQFRSLEFARVEAVKWKATDGHEVSGGLYFPPSYQPGQRYPLVIQTHGFRKDRFWMNGPWNSAFAAQPLASEGILVLQVGDSTETGDDHNLVNTPLEGPRRMAAFEGAIDDLDEKGLIDRSRVGIIGFSRTVFHAEYTLTHSTYRFRAATFADGFEGGYLSYLLWRTADYEGVNGGIPVGDGLNTWIKNSPAFRIENVTAPVRLEYYGSTAFLGGWQWFSVSSLLGKPVDFVWIPHGTHLLIKPSERLVSQQGNVDWFRFWLGDDHNCGAESRETCIRWNELASRANLQGH